ncbi:TPA: HAD family phosphatase [Candidatus Woesearchaeota archaeon]|nr:HAD family phosphatase [Candidatus Woesearchaeota archaeon]
MAIKAIFFDLGGVLVTEILRIIEGAFSEETGSSREEVRKVRDRYWLDSELGRMSGREFMANIVGDLGLKKDPDALVEKSCSLITVKEDVLEILKKIGATGRYKLGVISNNTFEWSDHSKNTLGLGKYFDFWLVSCDIGVKKPDPEIFDVAAKMVELEREECLLIDDKQRNIGAAASAGMKCILFKDSEQLLEDLNSLGIDI